MHLFLLTPNKYSEASIHFCCWPFKSTQVCIQQIVLIYGRFLKLAVNV